MLVKAHGNSLSHWPYLWSRCGIYHQSIPTWFHDLSLLGVGGLASRTLKPLWFIGQKLARNLKINDSVSCRERVEEKSHSLQCPMGGQGKTDREGERKSTGGYYRSCAGLFDPYTSRPQVFHRKHLGMTPSFSLLQSFSVCSSPNFTASLKRKSIYHSAQMRESLNRWRTSTQRQRFPIGPPATCKMVWIAEVTNVVLVNHSCLLGGFTCFGCKTFLFSLWTCVIPNWPPQSSPTSPSSYQSATFVHACFHWLPNIKQKSIKHWIKASNNHQKEL